MTFNHEDHLLVAIDYFIDFANNVFLLGYDLRIDAYSYCRFPRHFYFESIEFNTILRVQKNRIESNMETMSHSLDENYFYLVSSISPDDLNPIEKIYYTHYQKKKSELLTDENPNPNRLWIQTGTVKKVTEVVSLLGKCLDLKIICTSNHHSPATPTLIPKTDFEITARTQEFDFQVEDSIIFLIKKNISSQGMTLTLLGVKPKKESASYFNSTFLDKKNDQIKWIDYR